MKQFFVDLSNFFKFKRDVKSELARANSKMTRYNIKPNWLGNILYTQVNCEEIDLINCEYDSFQMLSNRIKPIVHYLSEELGWGEYLVPQISNFVDEEGNPSLSYGVLFIFTGYKLTLTKALVLILVLLGIVAASIVAICLL